jgi:hypothetical protein
MVVSGVGLTACLVFVVHYQVLYGFTWWRLRNGQANPFGRYLMFRKILLAGLFALVLTNRFWPGWMARPMVTAILMTLFAFQTFVPYRLLLQAHDREAQRR